MFNTKQIDKQIIGLSLLFGFIVTFMDAIVDVHFFDGNTVMDQVLRPEPFEIYIRGLIMAIFLLFGFIASDIITRLKQSEAEKTKTIQDLQKANEEIKILKGIIPICAACKKIRDDQGFWRQLESFIHAHSEAQFSHGICPDCMEELYGDITHDVQ